MCVSAGASVQPTNWQAMNARTGSGTSQNVLPSSGAARTSSALPCKLIAGPHYRNSPNFPGQAAIVQARPEPAVSDIVAQTEQITRAGWSGRRLHVGVDLTQSIEASSLCGNHRPSEAEACS